MPEKILLGHGTLAINGVDIALTRGGSQFVSERVNRKIVADGDYGGVKGRIIKDSEEPKLTLRSLTVIPANIPLMYPALDADSTTVPGTTTITARKSIAETDYIDNVTWTGETLDGDDVIIDVQNALNLGNIDWTMVDKDEVIPETIFTGHYTEADRTTPPFNVKYVTP